MNRDELMAIIPHRDHMFLVDEAEIRDGKACGKYRIKGDEFFLRGHFPGHPVVPGVILCEMMAQATSILLKDRCTASTLPFLTGLDKVRFRHPVVPGDIFESECTIKGSKGPFYFATGTGYVSGRICVTADFSFAIVK